MWDEDNVLDQDNLEAELVKTARLHAKYHTLWMRSQVFMRDRMQDADIVQRTLYDYYRRLVVDQETLDLIEKDSPWEVISTHTEIKYLVETDPFYLKLTHKAEKAKLRVKITESYLSTILRRDYLIKNIIDVRKLDRGII